MSQVYSMTGYAAAQAPSPLGIISLEVRSVNSRFLDLTLRTADELKCTETALRSILTQSVGRGKVEIRTGVKAELNETSGSINPAALSLIQKLQTEVLAELPEARPMSAAEILAYPGVVRTAEANPEELTKIVSGLLTTALEAFKKSAEREGAALAEVLKGYCDKIDAIADAVQVRMPDIVAAAQAKLTQRLEDALSKALTAHSQLTSEEVSDRIRTEATLYAMKIDVDEEVTRLKTHTKEVRRVLTAGGPVGKRLDFLMQEMNREANTLGSKAAAIEMTDASLNLKLLIEQMREQIQNLA